MGKVIVVGSHKNDIGKTIVSISIAASMAKSGNNVLLMDLSKGKKKASEYLNVNENIIYDIKDVMDLTCSLNLAAIDIQEGLSLLPSPRVHEKLGKISKESFAYLIHSASNYDVIIIDLDEIHSSYIDFSLINHVITINNNDFSCIKELSTDKKIAEKFEVGSVIAVINKYNKSYKNNVAMMKLKDIQRLSDIKILTVIEENKKYIEINHEFFFNNAQNSFNKSIHEIIQNLI